MATPSELGHTVECLVAGYRVEKMMKHIGSTLKETFDLPKGLKRAVVAKKNAEWHTLEKPSGSLVSAFPGA